MDTVVVSHVNNAFENSKEAVKKLTAGRNRVELDRHEREWARALVTQLETLSAFTRLHNDPQQLLLSASEQAKGIYDVIDQRLLPKKSALGRQIVADIKFLTLFTPEKTSDSEKWCMDDLDQNSAQLAQDLATAYRRGLGWSF